jgi:UDP-N-acetyl-D-glucosamine dehydrogenase
LKGLSGRLAVIGGGFVGLNVAVHGALRGLDVIVVDVSRRVVDLINSGVPSVRDVYVVENWPQSRYRIRASTEYSEVINAQWVVVAVNTPMKVYGRSLVKMLESDKGSTDDYIDFKPLEVAGRRLGEVLESNTLVSSEVTIYPGGTVERLGFSIESSSKHKVEETLRLVHSPERINPGDRVWNISNIPRVLGGLGKASVEAGINFYKEVLGIPVARVTGLMEAELSKLVENAQRLANITLVSSIKVVSDTAKVDFNEALEGASTKPFGFQRYRPGYAGGPCLVKDTLMLYLWVRDKAPRSPFKELLKQAIVLNELYLEHLASRVEEVARDRRAKKILFHGLGYKPGSPFFVSEDINTVWRLMRELETRGFHVKAYDPEIPERSNFQNFNEAREWADLVIGWGREGDISLEHL